MEPIKATRVKSPSHTDKGVLRRIEQVNRVDRVRNVDVRLRLEVCGVVRRRQEKWKNRLELRNE